MEAQIQFMYRIIHMRLSQIQEFHVRRYLKVQPFIK